MWGNILTELSYMQNFNMSFSNNKADVLIHLTQWQYWWWFWFTFLWVLYYLLVARVFRYRTLKFNPRIASTLRPHGKWGDLLTCLIPVVWCLNILINSNFILKLIEWQSESSLFTLRVRAKQWYWIYKLDLRNISDIFSAPRNIGRNKWQFATFGDLQTAEDYLHIMQMRAYNSWSKEFWTELNKKSLKKNRFNISTSVEVYKSEFLSNARMTFYRDLLGRKNLSVPRSTSAVTDLLSTSKTETRTLENTFESSSEKEGLISESPVISNAEQLKVIHGDSLILSLWAKVLRFFNADIEAQVEKKRAKIEAIRLANLKFSEWRPVPELTITFPPLQSMQEFKGFDLPSLKTSHLTSKTDIKTLENVFEPSAEKKESAPESFVGFNLEQLKSELEMKRIQKEMYEKGLLTKKKASDADIASQTFPLEVCYKEDALPYVGSKKEGFNFANLESLKQLSTSKSINYETPLRLRQRFKDSGFFDLRTSYPSFNTNTGTFIRTSPVFETPVFETPVFKTPGQRFKDSGLFDLMTSYPSFNTNTRTLMRTSPVFNFEKKDLISESSASLRQGQLKVSLWPRKEDVDMVNLSIQMKTALKFSPFSREDAVNIAFSKRVRNKIKIPHFSARKEALNLAVATQVEIPHAWARKEVSNIVDMATQIKTPHSWARKEVLKINNFYLSNILSNFFKAKKLEVIKPEHLDEVRKDFKRSTKRLFSLKEDKIQTINTFNLLVANSKAEKHNFIKIIKIKEKNPTGKNPTGKNPIFPNRFLFLPSLKENVLTKKFLKTKFFKREEAKPVLDILFSAEIKPISSGSLNFLNNFFQSEILDSNFKKRVFSHPDFDDETRILRKSAGKTTPIRVLKCPNNELFFVNSGLDSIELLRFRFNEGKSTLLNKPIKPTVYLTFKQKRYNQRTNISNKTADFFDKNSNTRQLYSGNPFLKDMSIIEENYGAPTRQYRMVKKAKSRVDTTRVATWNRLLRSRRVLVLPAHVNITVITNSFDVVHSWHIPGLGLKMDCLPGRATHHTMYIDNVGLYYGQCAEICGRYHHHMPIRVCALPFEHFLVWWHTFGLPKFLFSPKAADAKLPASKYLTRQFSW